MMIRIIKDVWDRGDDHHPAVRLAREGEALNVLETVGDRYVVARNGRFFVERSECYEVGDT